MRTYLFSILAILLIILSNSCREDLEYATSAGNLEFSRDTVFLDTIFTTIASRTYTLKVYNRNRDDVEIPSIRLAQGENSKYRLNVDGVAGKTFTDIPIFAQDSIFIFIETTVDASSNVASDFLYTDVLQFDEGDDLQEVALVTLVKDAIFLYPKTIANGSKETVTLGTDSNENEVTVEGFSLEDTELHFTNEKPYVIYGYATVPSEKELIIDPGARVHFHKDSGIYVKPNASIQINGVCSKDQETLENEVIFQGDRLENDFANISGQWGAIWLAAGSINNTINYLTIKNATVGLLVEGDGLLQSPTLHVQNTQIYNSASINLWAKTAFINGENLVLGGAGNISLFCNIGGSYSFTHCTIANYWLNGFRSGSALEIDNSSMSIAADLTKANFTNCIIDGNSFLELDLQNNELNDFNYQFTNSLIKFRDDSSTFEDNPLYDFQNTNNYLDIVLNQKTNFLNTNENNFKIGDLSAAKNKANLAAALQVPLDILGKDRTSSPSIGAYQIQQEN